MPFFCFSISLSIATDGFYVDGRSMPYNTYRTMKTDGGTQSAACNDENADLSTVFQLFVVDGFFPMDLFRRMCGPPVNLVPLRSKEKVSCKCIEFLCE